MQLLETLLGYEINESIITTRGQHKPFGSENLVQPDPRIENGSATEMGCRSIWLEIIGRN